MERDASRASSWIASRITCGSRADYIAEGKSYLTVAIGCTGGRHRSVMIAERLKRRWRTRRRAVRVRHRDVAHA